MPKRRRMRGGQRDTKCRTNLDDDFPQQDFNKDQCQKDQLGNAIDIVSMEPIPDQNLIRLVCQIDDKKYSKCYDFNTLYKIVETDIKSKIPETPEDLARVRRDLTEIEQQFQGEEREERINNYMFQRYVERAPKDAKEPTTQYKFTPMQKGAIYVAKWKNNIDAPNPELRNFTPLITSIIHPFPVQITRKILLLGADPNRMKALAMAIIGGRLEHVNLLLNHPNTEIYNPSYPFIFVAINMIKKEENPEVLRNRLQILRLLLEDSRTDFTSKDSNGSNILHHAISIHPQIVKSIIDKLKSLNILASLINSQDNFGNTPLILAVIQRVPRENIELLLNNGADKTIRNNLGKTALEILQG